MKKKMIWISGAFLVFCLAGGVNASYIGTSVKDSPTGLQDDAGSVTKWLTQYQDLYDITADNLAGLTGFKIDVKEDGLSKGGYSISGDGTTGTWTAPDGSDIDFITVKSGTEYAVFLADDFDWSTMSKHDISHITFWSAPKFCPPGGGSFWGPAFFAPLCDTFICAYLRKSASRISHGPKAVDHPPADDQGMGEALLERQRF